MDPGAISVDEIITFADGIQSRAKVSCWIPRLLYFRKNLGLRLVREQEHADVRDSPYVQRTLFCISFMRKYGLLLEPEEYSFFSSKSYFYYDGTNKEDEKYVMD